MQTFVHAQSSAIRWALRRAKRDYKKADRAVWQSFGGKWDYEAHEKLKLEERTLFYRLRALSQARDLEAAQQRGIIIPPEHFDQDDVATALKDGVRLPDDPFTTYALGSSREGRSDVHLLSDVGHAWLKRELKSYLRETIEFYAKLILPIAALIISIGSLFVSLGKKDLPTAGVPVATPCVAVPSTK